jgi:hypothetical protein
VFIISGHGSVSHTSPCNTAGRLEVQCLTQTIFIRIQKQRKMLFFLLFLDVVSNFLIRNLFFNYFLIVSLLCFFWLFLFIPKKIQYFIATLMGYHCLVLKSASLPRKRTDVWLDKDRQLLHTKLCMNTSRVTSLSKTRASNQNISRTNWNACILYKFILGIKH